MVDYKNLQEKIQEAVDTLLPAASLKKGDIFVLGCSSSEVLGEKIGSASNLEVAEHIFQIVYEETQKNGLFIAVQCCEHLNRALVVEGDCAIKYNLEVVNAIPHLKAGGATATTAMASLKKPVLVEKIQGHAGLDIGDTFIGMHLKPVVVPVRPPHLSIGSAHLTMARTRPKLIGGERAKYA